MDAETIWTFLQLHYTALTHSDARWPLANSDIDVATSPAFSGCCANKGGQYPETERLFVNRKADGDLEACGMFFVEMACIVKTQTKRALTSSLKYLENKQRKILDVNLAPLKPHSRHYEYFVMYFCVTK